MAKAKGAAKGSSKLPAALVKNALAKKDARRAALAREGFAAIADVHALRTKIADDFLAMGRALVTLKRREVYEAVGFDTFEALVEAKLDLSATRAATLVALFARLDAETVRALGVDRASALMNLADATPADDDVPALMTAKLTLPDGSVLDVAKASVPAIVAAATAFRRARGTPGARRGFTVGAVDPARLEAALRTLEAALGHRPVARLVATRKKTGADVTLRMTLEAFEGLAKRVGRAKTGRG